MTEELKKQTLDHWHDNLRRLKAMDWRKWRKCSYDYRINAMRHNDPDTPQIFGEHCPLCAEYFHGTCGACPLARPIFGTECCKEWYAAKGALLSGPYKKNAIAAFKAMIKRIEEIVV